MTSISIGLVSEGKSDFHIFEWCLGAALREIGIESRFRRISPVLDSTSGTYTEGGWRKVYQWCLRNKLGDRGRFFGGGLFAGDEDDLDVILVHLDGDIHPHFISQHPGDLICPVQPEAWGSLPAERVNFCRALIEDWLFGSAPVDNRDACAATPTIMATEAWLIGGLGYHPTPENLANPKADFARLWLLNTGRVVPPNIRKLKKHADEVQRAVGSSRPNLDFANTDAALQAALAAARVYAK